MLRLCALLLLWTVAAVRMEQDLNASVKMYKLDFVDVKKADKKFRGGDEPVLVPGEVVEMAFHDGYRDWALLTNWRVLIVDGETNAMTGYGKSAIPNKITYSSKLWHLFNSAKVTTALSSLDRDVEVQLLPMGATNFAAIPGHPVEVLKVTLEITSKIGSKKLFEVGEFVKKKIRAAEATRISLQTIGTRMTSMSWFNGGIPSIGRCKPDDRSLEQILGPGIRMIKKGETVLYKFHETFNPLRRYDDMIVTDKQVIVVDHSAGKKRQSYLSYPYLKDNKFQPWNYIASWEMSTAARRGADLDSELKANAGASAAEMKQIFFKFDRRHVSTPEQFKMHSKLQDKLAGVWKTDFSGMK